MLQELFKQLVALFSGKTSGRTSKKMVMILRNRERVKRVLAHQQHVQQAEKAMVQTMAVTQNMAQSQQQGTGQHASQINVMPGKTWVDKTGTVRPERRTGKSDRRKYKRNRRRAMDRSK